MHVYIASMYAFRGPSHLITANQKDVRGVILTRADIYMYVSETHICIDMYVCVHTYIYKELSVRITARRKDL